MELKGDLQILIEKAWALHDGIADEIKNSSDRFCALCYKNGQSLFQEKQRLFAIRDSLKDVGDVLVFLQRLRSWQAMDKHAALTRLEESRVNLIERVKEYKGRSLDVLNEVNCSFNNGKTAFERNLSSRIKKKKQEMGFIMRCIRMVFDSWKWHRALFVAAKLAFISATVPSAVRLVVQTQTGSNMQQQQKL